MDDNTATTIAIFTIRLSILFTLFAAGICYLLHLTPDRTNFASWLSKDLVKPCYKLATKALALARETETLLERGLPAKNDDTHYLSKPNYCPLPRTAS